MYKRQLVHPDVVYAAEGDLPTFQYLLALGSQPTAPVTVSCIVDERDASIVPASYVFDSTNWNIPQFVRGTVNDDVIDEGDVELVAVEHEVVSPDGEYDDLLLPPPTISLLITANDVAERGTSTSEPVHRESPEN